MHDTIQFDLRIDNQPVFVSSAVVLDGRVHLGVAAEGGGTISHSLDLAALKAWIEESEEELESGNVMYTFWHGPEIVAAAA